MSEPYIRFDRRAGMISSFDATGTQSVLDTDAYSGAPGFQNDPTTEDLPDKGPIPAGWWSIGADTGEKGPLTLLLTPDSDTQVFGRSGFLWHGANATKDIAGMQMSSEGCIVSAHQSRAIGATFTRLLVV